MARLLKEGEAHIGSRPRADMGVTCERPHGPLVCAVMLHGPPPVRGQAWTRILAALPLLPVTKNGECQPNMQRHYRWACQRASRQVCLHESAFWRWNRRAKEDLLVPWLPRF